MLFWSLIVLFSLAAMAALSYPLMRRPDREDDRLEREQALYRERISEIDRDVGLGRINDKDAIAAKAEVGRSLIKSQRTGEFAAAGNGRGGKALLLSSILFVPLSTGLLYLALGTPPAMQFTGDVSETAGEEQPSIQALLAAAEQRLAKNPDDGRGWKVIAPVYNRLGRFDEAIQAFQNALRLEGREPDLTFGLGEAFMGKANGQVTPQALALFEETAELMPSHPVARFYLGVHAMQQGDNDKAMATWENIIADAKGDESWLPVIHSYISRLEEQDQLAKQASPDDPEQLVMVSGMVASLEEKLKDNPQDKEGWEMLIRSYVVLDRIEEAKNAIATARSSFPEDKPFLQQLDQTEAALPEVDGKELNQ